MVSSLTAVKISDVYDELFSFEIKTSIEDSTQFHNSYCAWRTTKFATRLFIEESTRQIYADSVQNGYSKTSGSLRILY
jgi:hypothetical protein